MKIRLVSVELLLADTQRDFLRPSAGLLTLLKVRNNKTRKTGRINEWSKESKKEWRG